MEEIRKERRIITWECRVCGKVTSGKRVCDKTPLFCPDHRAERKEMGNIPFCKKYKLCTICRMPLPEGDTHVNCDKCRSRNKDYSRGVYDGLFRQSKRVYHRASSLEKVVEDVDKSGLSYGHYMAEVAAGRTPEPNKKTPGRRKNAYTNWQKIEGKANQNATEDAIVYGKSAYDKYKERLNAKAKGEHKDANN